jgi:hypothetical protein
VRATMTMLAAAAALAVTGAPGGSPPASAAHGGLSYEGHYANAFVAGRAADGRAVAVMGGYHVDFPYHHRGSRYDQVAIFIAGAKPIVVTGRPKLSGFELKPGPKKTRLSYRGPRVRFELAFKSVRHPPLYEGDPADLGDFFLDQAFESDRRPGLVYTPYELIRLARGTLVLQRRHRSRTGGRREVELRGLHGQAEVGEIDAPTDRRFRSAYDYLAAPTLGRRGYTYVGFETHALHAGPDGAFGPYYGATASEEFTLQNRRFTEGNPHAVPAPFDNTGTSRPGARELARWRVDLGPGILHRALVRLRDGAGRPLIALSETIKEDRRG